MRFQPTPAQRLEVSSIVAEMLKAGLPDKFVARLDEIGRQWEGVYDLMVLWRDAANDVERAQTEADLDDALGDIDEAPPEPTQKPYIPFDDLDSVAGQVKTFKRNLRDLIDRHGGVTEVARKSGIPQPSLSRLLNSASMPRRTTLYRIANALNIPETEIVTDWVR